jgi:hypothetical protein
MKKKKVGKALMPAAATIDLPSAPSSSCTYKRQSIKVRIRSRLFRDTKFELKKEESRHLRRAKGGQGSFIPSFRILRQDVSTRAHVRMKAHWRTLANVMSGYWAAMASKCGPIIRQGPHHPAEKSTTTSPFVAVTAW